jgi:lysophospholipase L1-like esterase
MLALGTGLSDIAPRRPGGAPSPAPLPSPAPIFTRFVIEGDSITSHDPQQTTLQGDFYSYTWANSQTGITAFVTADGSRTIGGPAFGGDAEDTGTPYVRNTLLAARPDDLALTPHLMTAMIGTNDLLSIQTATYIQRLRDWAGPIRAAGVKVAYAPPPPVDTSYGGYTAFMAKWNALFSTHAIRNPASWSQWADYYIPMGEHPDFALGGHTSDDVHPTAPATNPASGQGKLLAIYSAAMSTLRDTSRFAAAGPYQSVWDAFGPFTDLAPGATITRRVHLSGLAWAGRSEGVSVTGAGSPSVKTNGKTAPGWSYNGDVVDLTLTLSSANLTDTAVQLTIGGETRTLTFRTAANVTPAAYVHGDVIGIADGVGSQSFPNLTFQTGRAVVMLKAHSSVASTVTLNGVAMTLRERRAGGDGTMEIWDAPVTAGSNHTVAVTYGGYTSHPLLSYGTITTGAFVSATGTDGPYQSGPHTTPAVTVPANGIAVAGFLESAASFPATTTTSGTTLVDEGNVTFQGGTFGIAVGTRTTSGAAGFNFAFGSFPRVIAVYRAA